MRILSPTISGSAVQTGSLDFNNASIDGLNEINQTSGSDNKVQFWVGPQNDFDSISSSADSNTLYFTT